MSRLFEIPRHFECIKQYNDVYIVNRFMSLTRKKNYLYTTVSSSGKILVFSI